MSDSSLELREVTFSSREVFQEQSDTIVEMLFQELSDWHYLNFTKDTSIWESSIDEHCYVYIEYDTHLLIELIRFQWSEESSDASLTLHQLINTFQSGFGLYPEP